MREVEYLLKNHQELAVFAAEFLAGLKPNKANATVVGLSGDLGAGKTAFTKAVAAVLGIHEEILSPTFVLAKFYPLTKQPWNELIHIDAYRIENENELTALRFDEMINDPTKLIIIEWPEQLGKRFPEFACTLKFTFIDETTRMIQTTP